MRHLSRDPDVRMKITVKASTVGYALAGLIVFLTLANLLVHFGRLELGWGQSFGLRRQFNLGRESNIPTYYSALALLLAGVLLLLIAKCKFSEKDRYRFEWLGLGLGFVFLSIDESTMIHENYYRVSKMLGFGEPGFSSWLAFNVLILLGVGLAYWRFLVHLDSGYRRMFLFSAVLFVGGAVGLEAVGDLLTTSTEQANWPRILVMSAEELLEMTGVALFVVTLLRYLEEHLGDISIAFSR